MWRNRTSKAHGAFLSEGLNAVEKDDRFWEVAQSPELFCVRTRTASRPISSPYGKRRENLLKGQEDTGLWLPFALQLGAGRGGGPDIQLKVFQFTVGSAFSELQPRFGSIALREDAGWFGNMVEAATFAGEVGGVVMAQILFPGVMSTLGGIFWLAGLASLVMGPNSIVRKAFTALLSGAGRGLTKNWSKGPSRALACFCCSINTLAVQMSGPMTVVFLSHLLWKRLHKKSHTLAESSVALMKVSRSYHVVRKNTAKGLYQNDEEIEKAWLDTHKEAAQRVAHLMTELPERPPLKSLLDFWDATEILTFLVPEVNHGYHGYGLSNPKSIKVCINHGSCLSNSFKPYQLEAGEPSPSSGAEVLGRQDIYENSPGASGSQPDPGLETVTVGTRDLFGALSRKDDDGNAPGSSAASDVSVWDSCAEAERIHSSPRGPQLPTLYEETASCTSTNESNHTALPLFGRGDHVDDADQTLTAREKTVLVMRAMKLFFIFMPVVLFGGMVLVMANAVESRTEKDKDLVKISKKKKQASEMRTWAFNRLLGGCRTGGAAFIKWGQWSASREDLFPAEFCDALSQLHDHAPVHSAKQTRAAILEAFSRPVEDIFNDFEETPFASGSIAQVHRATIMPRGSAGIGEEEEPIPVVVKVRHPRVAENINQDFQVLKPLAAWASTIPMLQGLPLKESVSQFSHTMTAQTNLRVEAIHIRRMFDNFRRHGDSIVIPAIVDNLVSEGVIVESFEEGRSVTHYMKNPSPLNTRIVALGVDAYLKMLLADNVVHTDLHPGNILVREVPQSDGSTQIQLILLDFGLVEELTPTVRHHFISFLNMISKGDGEGAARHFLQWSNDQQCPDPDAFVRDMVTLFNNKCNIYTPDGIDLDGVIKSILLLSRNHRVSIDSSYAALVVGVCIIVGFATSLDPRVNLMDAATPVLLTYALTGRVVGRMYG